MHTVVSRRGAGVLEFFSVKVGAAGDVKMIFFRYGDESHGLLMVLVRVITFQTLEPAELKLSDYIIHVIVEFLASGRSNASGLDGVGQHCDASGAVYQGYGLPQQGAFPS